MRSMVEGLARIPEQPLHHALTRAVPSPSKLGEEGLQSPDPLTKCRVSRGVAQALPARLTAWTHSSVGRAADS